MNGALSTVRRHAVTVPVSLIGIDRAITLAHWGHESNPIVTGLGIGGWLTVTVMSVAGLLYLWYTTEVSESRVAVACVVFLSALMGMVVVGNGLYLTGLWPF